MAGPGAAPPAFARLVDIEMRKLLDQVPDCAGSNALSKSAQLDSLLNK
jgi:hypothetical protein